MDVGGLQSVAAWVFWLVAGVFGYALVGYAGLMKLAARWKGEASRRRKPTGVDPEASSLACSAPIDRAGRHVGAPSSVNVQSKKASGSPDDTADTPTVTLIIPAHNEEAVLERKIENALALDYPREKLEILIASDGSTDGTVEIARRYEGEGVRALAFPQRRGKTAVVNDAAEAAEGEVLCLCDANVMFRHDALLRLVARLADRRVGAVSGDVRLASEESSFGQGESAYYGLERAVQTGESIVGSMMGVDGGMYVVRRQLFEPIPPDTIVDDFVYAMRVIRQGRRVVLEASAIATENGTPEATQEFGRRVRLSAGAMQALKRGDFPPITRPVEFWQFVSHKLLRWLGPVWLVVLLVSNVLLWNSGLVYRVMLGAQAAFYGLAVAATFSLPLRRTRIGGIVFYFVMSHVAMGVGLVKGLFNRQRVTWNRTERICATACPVESESRN